MLRIQLVLSDNQLMYLYGFHEKTGVPLLTDFWSANIYTSTTVAEHVLERCQDSCVVSGIWSLV